MSKKLNKKRFEIGRFNQQFFILPAFGAKKTYTYDGTTYYINFAWLNRGLAMRLFTIKD